MQKDEIISALGIPNDDLAFEDVEIIKSKPLMPFKKRVKINKVKNEQLKTNVSNQAGNYGQ